MIIYKISIYWNNIEQFQKIHKKIEYRSVFQKHGGDEVNIEWDSGDQEDENFEDN